ncbi:hypothetical protein [Paraliobacillus ryukyuensis]|uniref:hypothetical protein n=1 Tax=Paraliobacillus ryukyuensis TaxID=200904 RepID=UPI0009A72286|nr:hypothetical protein [Paraliobacillus ryukyuensis]
MRKYFVSLIVVLALSLLSSLSSVHANETAEYSKVKVEDSLEKNTMQDFEMPTDRIKMSQGTNQPILKNKLGIKQHRMITSSVTSQATNDSPNTPAIIEIGQVYTDKITEEGQQKWYRFEHNNSGKLTVIMQTVQSASIDYDLHLFKLNEETMTLEEEVISSYDSEKNEQLSKISEGGIYYIAVNSVTGSEPNLPFTFLVQQSTSYDQKEPDDNIYQAPAYLNHIYESQTIDNSYDLDWFILQVDQEKTLTVNLDNPSSADYQLDIFDLELNGLAGLEDNEKYSISFPPGTYLLRVQSTSLDYDANQSYTLDIKEQAGEATSAEILNINTDGNVEGYMNYGYGYKWRIDGFMEVEGKAVDENGTPVPNTNIEVRIITVLNNRAYIEPGLTDRKGNFKIKIPKIQEAVGNYSYTTYSSYHYFDIIPFDIMSNGKVLDSNENSLYHFAYSTYRPH